MKLFKKLVALVMVMVLCLTLFAACIRNQVADPETRPLTMGIQTPDEVFNPFFSTSAMDSTIISMTQIGMMTSTAKGEPKCGDDEPVVVKDYKIVTAEDDSYTEYYFIIKNGIKFSDGTPLTIKDVLFNLYVYLDPVYTGSSTIYSTDIVGLQAYRQNDQYATNDSASAFEERFVKKARQRIDELLTFVQAYGIYTNTEIPRPPKNYTDEQIKSFQEDIAYVAKEFRKELESDWNSADVESYKDQGFTQKWQVFLYQDAQVDFYKKDAEGKYIKDKEGKKQLDPDISAEYERELDAYLEANKLTKTDENIRAWALDAAYMPYFSEAVVGGMYDETVFNADKIAKTIERINSNQFEIILAAWMTGSNLETKYVADIKTEEIGGTTRNVQSISGITTEKTSQDYHGHALDAEHDVLKITINGIDPKAIWNFSFNVAPLHYYSGTYEGVDYVASFDASKGNFGVKVGDKKFFDNVINEQKKSGVPLGAGVYMASTYSGGAAKTKTEFFDSNTAYYERNPYFNTLGSGICNAKIKYFRYQVVESDQVMNALTTGNIDIGEPNATPENEDELKAKKYAYATAMTSGYGYVGINPRFVPDVAVRRAIMKAMNKQMIQDDYYKNMCKIIERPMSMANWAYPGSVPVYSTDYVDKDGQPQTVTYNYDSTGEEIIRLVESVGYTKGTDGIYQRKLYDGSTHRLSYKFTIAGSSTDHPAYKMFVNAANILNKIGFDINVVTSQSALSDLSSGKLTVWAAAWSSTIDPDMYQVYHKDSTATSVNNWGYPQIKAKKSMYSYEYNLIEELSKLIDQGRKTNDQDERKPIYASALNKVMELAVEFPTYQRNDMTAFNPQLLDRNTMTPEGEIGPYNGLLSRIWELNYIQR